MKYFIIIVSLIFLNLSAYSAVITGGVEYSVQEARDSVVNSVLEPVSKAVIKQNLFDINRNENLSKLLIGQTSLKDRKLAYFSDGSYGVNYLDNSLVVFYYDNSGFLINTERRSSLEYPYKSYKYELNGELVNMSLRVSEGETFIFDTNQNLIAHWVGANCYDEGGNIIMTRKMY